MNAAGPIVGLRVESRPETLTIVRGMLSGVAELLEMDPELLDDVKTAVSEACNNVVLHAYGEGETGPMEVRVGGSAEALEVEVDDAGVGFDGVPVHDTSAVPGIGVSVIRALSGSAAFSVRATGGTTVVMRFPARRDGHRLFAAPPPAAPLTAEPGTPPADGLEVSFSPVRLLTGVLGRLARTVAASAHFSLDRFSDVYLVTDTLAAHAAVAASGERMWARLRAEPRCLTIELGPFDAGSGAALTEGGARTPLRLLVDELEVCPEPDGETLRLVVRDDRAR